MPLVDLVKKNMFTKDELSACLNACDDRDWKKELLNAMNDIFLTREITSATDRIEFKRLIDQYSRISTISEKERNDAVAAMCKFSGLAFKAGAASAAANEDFTTLIPQHYASDTDITITYDIDDKQRGNLQNYVNFLLAELAAQLQLAGKREAYATGENQASFNTMKSFFTHLPMKPAKLNLINLNLNLKKLLGHLRANDFDFANINIIDRAEEDDEEEVEVTTVRNMDMRILTFSTHDPLPSEEFKIEKAAESLTESQNTVKRRVETPGYATAREKTKTTDDLLKEQKTTDREEIQKYFGDKLEFTVTIVDDVSTVAVKKPGQPMSLIKFTAEENEDGDWKALEYVAGERASYASYQERLQILTFIAEQAVKANKKLKEPRLMLRVKATCADNYIMNAFVIMNGHIVPYFNAAGRDAILQRRNELEKMNPNTMSPEDAMILRMVEVLIAFKNEVGGDPVWIKAAKGTNINKTSTMLIEHAFDNNIIRYWERSLERNKKGMTGEAIDAMKKNIALTKQNSLKIINHLRTNPDANKEDDCVAGAGNKKKSIIVSSTRGTIL